MILSYLPRVFYDMLEGISLIKPWHLAIFYIPTLLLVYAIFEEMYSGIRTFLFLLFFSFMIYPTTSFYLFNYNKGNYLITNELQLIQKDLAQDKIEREISIEDLVFLLKC